MGQDMVKGRRTEIEFLNGLVAKKGEEIGIADAGQRGADRHRHARREGRAEARSEAHHRSAAELTTRARYRALHVTFISWQTRRMPSTTRIVAEVLARHASRTPPGSAKAACRDR